jgi:hypothetical protein
MSKLSNTNYNHVSVKTDSMVKMLDQLAKLGVFKSKPKKRKSSKLPADMRQDSDMVGYVKTLRGEPGRGDPNLFALRQIKPGMSQQEIEDIQERNNAGIAALRAEVQQQRLADIEAQQGQRFADITRLGGIMNPILERFRGAQDPGAGQRTDPFAQSSTIFLPDIQEETFTETLNEGGPMATPAIQTKFFAESGEEEGIPTSGGGGQPFQPVQPIIKAPSKYATPAIKKRAERGTSLGLGPPPQARNTSQEKISYYLQLAAKEDFEPDTNIRNAKGYLDAINAYLDDDRNFLST